MRIRMLLCIVLGPVLVLAACGADDTEAAESTTTTTETTTTVSQGFDILQESAIVYHEDEEGTWTMDVHYPDAQGPWPLVVVYHGMTTGRSNSEAREIARRGAVAVAPQWIKTLPPELTREEYIEGDLLDRAACAVGKAQEVAGDFGADPADTTVAGFSAGMQPAAWVGLGAMRIDGCAQPMTYQPVGLVLGDNQFIFYEDGWDASFADPESPATDTLDRLINPDRWSVPDDLAVYLWTSDYRHGRAIENPPASDSWIWGRDTTGTLVDDLTALGAFDDEWIGWMDNALLMELRMKAAGIDVVHEAVGGGHNYSPAVYDAIEALLTR